MNIKEASHQDLRQMFDKSIVTYDTHPIFIHHVNDDKSVDVSSLGNNKEARLHLSDEKFDFTPVSLGYVNVQGSCFYLTRVPRRQWKQGLHHDNVEIKYHEAGYPEDRRWMSAYNRIKELSCKPLYNTIKNIYPTLEEAVNLLQEDREVAFDRQFAINKDFIIFYKAQAVGYYNDGEIVFNANKEFLRKAL